MVGGWGLYCCCHLSAIIFRYTCSTRCIEVLFVMIWAMQNKKKTGGRSALQLSETNERHVSFGEEWYSDDKRVYCVQTLRKLELRV